MKISLHWLKEWVDIGDDVPALSHALTMAGLEIEGIKAAAPQMSGIVVGEVITVEKHPDAEKLSVCRVANGVEQLQIVCGAPNVRAGMKAPLANVGAKLPGGMEIKKARLRGLESSGMLCSARELGLSDEAAGLLELPGELTTGRELVQALALDDQILEVNLTPNRGDCMSVLGVAREVAATRRVPLRGPASVQVAATLRDVFPVRVESEGCGRFAGRVIRGVRAGVRSPLWLRERLRRAGLRPVSAVVDVTNYVMLELGQPMHAYDLARLNGAIVVRPAHAGESLRLLDGRTIELTPDVLVIADERQTLGMAGVMGGEDSGISDATVDVFLEVAFFEPKAIAGRGRRYGLITDASQRFERGVDPRLQERAIERATQLLLECAGGAAGPVVVTHAGAPTSNATPITLRCARLGRVLGADVPSGEVTAILQRLGMPTVEQAEGWQVSPPSWRFDIAIEEDLIEEVARLYGFHNIPGSDAFGQLEVTSATETRVPIERAIQVLVDRGYQEAVTYSFTDPALQSALFPDEAGVALSNPISAELATMRVSLWPGLVQVLRENQRRQQGRVRLFETGRRFASDSGAEVDVIGGIAAGPALPKQWGISAGAVDFFDMKADVEALLRTTGDIDSFRFERALHPALHPGQSARMLKNGHPVGWIGQLNPAVSKRLDLTYPAIVFELETVPVLAARIPEFEEISRYPAIRRDLALIVAESVQFQTVRDEVLSAAGPLLRDLGVFDVYRGQEIEKGKKSIALGLNLQDTSRTLTDQDADAIMARIVSHLERELNAVIRDK